MKDPSRHPTATSIEAATKQRAYRRCASVQTRKSCRLCLLCGSFTRELTDVLTAPRLCLRALTVQAQDSPTAEGRIWTPHLQINRWEESDKRSGGGDGDWTAEHPCSGTYLHAALCFREVNGQGDTGSFNLQINRWDGSWVCSTLNTE